MKIQDVDISPAATAIPQPCDHLIGYAKKVCIDGFMAGVAAELAAEIRGKDRGCDPPQAETRSRP